MGVPSAEDYPEIFGEFRVYLLEGLGEFLGNFLVHFLDHLTERIHGFFQIRQFTGKEIEPGIGFLVFLHYHRVDPSDLLHLDLEPGYFPFQFLSVHFPSVMLEVGHLAFQFVSDFIGQIFLADLDPGQFYLGVIELVLE